MSIHCSFRTVLQIQCPCSFFPTHCKLVLFRREREREREREWGCESESERVGRAREREGGEREGEGRETGMVHLIYKFVNMCTSVTHSPVHDT